MKILVNLFRDLSGSSSAEYALLLALGGCGVAIGAIALGDSISVSLESSAMTISEKGPRGKSGSAPGRNGNTRGRSGSAPGRTGETPGQSGAAPPGQSGAVPPGQQ